MLKDAWRFVSDNRFPFIAALVLDGVGIGLGVWLWWRKSTSRERRAVALQVRQVFAHDEPWSSAMVLLLLLATAGVGSSFVRSPPSATAALILIAAAVVTCWSVARRFTRATLRTVTLVLLLLVGLGMLGQGRNQIREERNDAAVRTADGLDAQLADLADAASAASETRVKAQQAIGALRTRVASEPDADLRTKLLNELDRLDAASQDADRAADTLQEVDTQLASLAKEADPPSNRNKALVEEVASLTPRVRSALEPTVGGPIQVAHDAVDDLRAKAAAFDPSTARGQDEEDDPQTAGKDDKEEDESSAAAEEDDPTLKALDVAVAKARLETARAVAAAGRAGQDGAKAVTEAEAAYVGAVGSEEPSVAAVDGLAAGGRRLAAGLPVIRGDGVPFAFETLGWLLLAGLALWAYRRQEARVGRGELLLNKVERSGGGDEATTERFRTYLSRNIPEPSAVPGASSALKPMTDLLTAASSTPATWVGRLLSGVAEAVKAPRGAVVRLAVLDDAKPDAVTASPRKAMIGVRVSPPGAPEQLQQTFLAPTLDEALRRGAYWASAVLVERSGRVPPWTVWSPEANEALATYYAQADTDEGPPIEALQEAVAVAPRSGLLLIELANQFAIQEQLVEAFALYLRAVMLYRRWPVAQYRLAATATMLAGDGASRWRAADEPVRQAVIAALCGSRLDRREQLLARALRGSDVDAQRRELCLFAEAMVDPGTVVGWRRVTWRLLRSTERAYWQSLLRTRSHVTFRSQFHALAESGIEMTKVRRVPSFEDLDLKVRKLAHEEGLTWQVTYNLACIHAELARRPHPANENFQEQQVETALRLLELAVTRPNGDQLTKEWLESDPDLAPLRDEPRFTRLANALPREDDQP